MKNKYQKKTKAVDTGTTKYEAKLGSQLFQHGYGPKFRQFKRKNNDMVAAAYEIYCSGKSLQEIAEKIYGGKFTRQSLYDVFKVRGYKLRSKKPRVARIYKGIAYRLGHGGYRSRVGGKTVYLHKLIWEEYNGKIPENHYIIFKDGNKENIVIENLVCLPSEAAKQTYNYRNQFGYQRFEGKGAFGL